MTIEEKLEQLEDMAREKKTDCQKCTYSDDCRTCDDISCVYYRDMQALEWAVKEIGTLDKMVDSACEMIADIWTCPLENLDIYMDCQNRCTENFKEIAPQCWRMYFEQQARKAP